MEIVVFADGAIRGSIENYPFVTGNRYTLVADVDPENMGAQYAVTDKLTWSSSDGKVAKISAVGGTYSATLKALKAGTTTIEVKSGILKQVIARWKITFRTVGDAYNNAHFYDEDEDLRGDGTDIYDTPEKLVLNVPTAVELAAGEKKDFKFTAEEAGKYRVVSQGEIKYSNPLGEMKKGETLPIHVEPYNVPMSGTITVEKVPGIEIENRKPIKLNEKLSVPAGGYAVFTAKKDGLYRFSGNIALRDRNDREVTGSSYNYGMKKDTTIYVKNMSSYEDTIEVTPVVTDSLPAGKEHPVAGYSWYTFTAPEKGDYLFTAKNNAIRVCENLDAVNNGDNTSNLYCRIEAGKTVYVYVDYVTKIKVEKAQTVAIAQDDSGMFSEQSVANRIEIDGETWLRFTASQTGIYTFEFDNSHYDSLICILLI